MVYISKTVAIIGIIGIALVIALVGIIVGVTTRKCTEFEPPPTAPSTTTPQPDTTSATAAASTTEPASTASITDTEEPTLTTTAEPDRDVRLPTNLVPFYYHLWLYIDMEPNFSTAGSWVSIGVTCVAVTNKIILHAFKSLVTIDPSKTTVYKVPTGDITINSQEYIEEKEFYVVTLANNLEEGTQYEINFEFSGEIPETTNGLYRSSYQESDGSVKWLASTHLQAPHARKIFPLFDEPQFKAVFRVTLVHHKKYHSLSNTYITRSEDVTNPPNWIEEHYEDTPLMSSYLLCFVISEFLSLEGTTSRGIEVRAWARPEVIDQAEYALNTTAIILEGFEDYFGIPYTNDLNKTELIALPVFSAGAMENWGLVVYRETRMLHESGQTPADEMKHICRVIAHELMHQWLGNMVTCEWWSHLWLNEGFSRYLEYVGCNFAEPEWKMPDEIIVIHMMPGAFRYDALATSHPLVNDAVTNTEVRAMFDTITYSKGGCIFQMIQALLGENAWRLSLTDYIKTNAYGTAVTDDLWDSMQKVINNEGIELDGKTMKEVMDPWTLQMGYPLLNVNRQYGGNHMVTITQEHFLLDPTAEVPPSNFSYLWEVPVFFTTQNDVNWENPEIIWMHQEKEITATISADDNQWFIANAGVKGFYRVMYDDNNWELIIKQLKDDHEVISLRNRAQLFEDAFELAKILKMEQVNALQLLEYLDEEVEYSPWHAALGKLNYLDLMLGKTGTYGLLKMFMVSQTEDMYNAIGWQEFPEKELQKRLFQVDITAAACKYGNSDCEEAALAQFQEWMDTGVNNIAVDRQISVYCTAIAKGDQEQWEFAWDQFIHTSDPADVTKLLEAMACSRQLWILQMYLERVLDGQVKSTDGDKVINYVGLNVAGNYLVWDFIRRHWDYLYETYKGSTSAMDRIVRGATDRFSTEYDLSQVEAFRATIMDRGGNMAYWTGAVENIHTNILWRAENDETIKEWLEAMDNAI